MPLDVFSHRGQRGLELAMQLWERWENRETPDVREFLAEIDGLGAADYVEVLQVDQHWRWRRGERVLVESYLRDFPAITDDTEAIIGLIFLESIATTNSLSTSI